MSAKFFKSMSCVIMCAAIVVFWAGISYCDSRPQPHIHIKGTVTDSDGKGVADARLHLDTSSSSSFTVNPSFLSGLPTGTHITAVATESWSGASPVVYKTSSTGEYHIIFKFAPGGETKTSPSDIDVSLISVDRSKMKWEKGGYVIKPK